MERPEQSGDRATAPGDPRPGERAPAGEDQGIGRWFTASEIASAFGVAEERVRRAFDGEFGYGAGGRVDSRQAQHLAEVILGDMPLDEREAALMRLGAFTPRPDDAWGMGDTAPGEESDRLAASPTKPEDRLASERSSHDPSQPHG